jgi:hypothetical protein
LRCHFPPRCPRQLCKAMSSHRSSPVVPLNRAHRFSCTRSWANTLHHGPVASVTARHPTCVAPPFVAGKLLLCAKAPPVFPLPTPRAAKQRGVGPSRMEIGD